MKMYGRFRTTLAVLVSFLIVLAPVHAQDGETKNGNANDRPTNQKSTGQVEDGDWDVSLGAGVLTYPMYEGSSRYVVEPFPYIRITWKDRVTLGPAEEVKADVLTSDFYTAGAGLTYGLGRDETGQTYFGLEETDRLDGLEDIDSAVGPFIYGSYDLSSVTLTGRATRYLGNDNDGSLVKLGVRKQYRPRKHIFLTPSVEVTWADEAFNDTFFGVTSTESNRSDFDSFDAGAGLKDVRLGLSTNYALDRRWILFSRVEGKQLLGDAADSPISEQETSVLVMGSLMYRF